MHSFERFIIAWLNSLFMYSAWFSFIYFLFKVAFLFTTSRQTFLKMSKFRVNDPVLMRTFLTSLLKFSLQYLKMKQPSRTFLKRGYSKKFLASQNLCFESILLYVCHFSKKVLHHHCSPNDFVFADCISSFATDKKWLCGWQNV